MAELRALTMAELRGVYRTHVTADFPPAERKPLSAMERLAARGVYDTLGFYEGAALLGYAFVWRNEGAGCAMLDYLAVCGGGRSRGTGTALLERLLGRYGADYLFFAEAEAETPDAAPAENHLRRRRLDFYRRAGFVDAGYQALLFGVRYAVLRYGGADMGGDGLMAAHRALYCQGNRLPFQGRLIKIPAQN